MAGSTISGGSTTGSRKAGGGGKKNHSNHTHHPGAANGKANANANANANADANGHASRGSGSSTSTYRVTIDVRKIQTNVYANEGGRLSELAVRNWLLSVGFHPEPGGRTWLADVESISRLDKSEIVRSERLHGSAARAG
jgi:hypothetical protein